jgi:transketolase N-terminal domain/subunit
MGTLEITAQTVPSVTQSTGDAMDQLCVNTIRTLAMDAVQAANSGHPGTPMALAPVVYWLWQRVLRFDPNHPIWPNRDRFVLSVGHASMLLYAMLHLTGVKAVNPKYETLGQLSVTLEDIKQFRQLDSKCPGHPEYRWTSGVETTTGPLGVMSCGADDVTQGRIQEAFDVGQTPVLTGRFATIDSWHAFCYFALNICFPAPA